MGTTHAYGEHVDQVADLYLPEGAVPTAGWPTVVLVHGGFWRERYTRELMAPLADDLARHGMAAWNLEFRRVRGGGGWPTTFIDVADGIDRLAGPELPVDPARVAIVGHSAGGHLALWAASRASMVAGAPGASPRVLAARVVGLAPVADLRACHDAGLSEAAAAELLGGAPDVVPDHWRLADPMGSVGHGVPILIVHGLQDAEVPVEFSRRYVAAARAAGGDPTLVTPACGHMEVIDPTYPSWVTARRWLAAEL